MNVHCGAAELLHLQTQIMNSIGLDVDLLTIAGEIYDTDKIHGLHAPTTWGIVCQVV